MQLIDLDKFQQISTDTRTLKRGDVFLALTGPNFDGHNFIEDAEKKGAKALIVSKFATSSIPAILVKDTFLALGELAKMRRDNVKIPIIGITGSCGKTTVKAMTASILSQMGETLFTKSNLNNNIGVPMTLLRITEEHKFAVIEIGASLNHEIDYAAKITKPNIAAITCAAPVHLEGFNDLDNVANIKGDLLRNLPNDGIAVLNADDHYFDYWKNLINNKKFISFGINNKAEIKAENINCSLKEKTNFILKIPDANAEIHLPLFGEHNVMNALAAAGIAFALKIPLEKIKYGLENMAQVKNRMIEQYTKKGALIIDDSYNANPVSMLAAINVLIKFAGKKIMVVGDMKELGKDEIFYHKELGKQAKKFGIDKLFAVGELTKFAVEAFGECAKFYDDRDKLIDDLKALSDDNTAILIKGSKVNHLWEIVERI